ncbi:hypothetical protein KIN20_011768 [Parelaphostrongylus tenuis]|uniref:Uncharacterized protein n=1 Tax=Parelaphostrongylus tenuis TaxID=148309 RepID=A0AAD5MVH6_PARTN|nr:hypothetical protein KIN20_011768 [Parelaphostrongylus tenuis]
MGKWFNRALKSLSQGSFRAKRHTPSQKCSRRCYLLLNMDKVGNENAKSEPPRRDHYQKFSAVTPTNDSPSLAPLGSFRSTIRYAASVIGWSSTTQSPVVRFRKVASRISSSTSHTPI